MTEEVVVPAEITNILAYCMKCKEKRIPSPSEGGDSPGVLKKADKYSLVGWCPVCGTKMNRFLSKTKDAQLILAYERSVEMAETPDVPAHPKSKAVAINQTEESPKAMPEKPKKSKKQPHTNVQKKVQKKKEKSTMALDEKGTKSKTTAKKVKKAVVVKKSNGQTKKPKVKTTAKKSQVRRSVSTKASAIKTSYPLKIFARYKGKTYRAIMKGTDNIRFSKQNYTSLSLAAVAVTEGKKVNGWRFWRFVHSDGEEYFVDSLRNPSEVKAAPRSGGTLNTAKIPPIDKDYTKAIPLPREGLPIRNSAAASAIYCVDPKTVRYNHLTAFLYVKGELNLIRYDKKGKPREHVPLGEFKKWSECFPKIHEIMEKRSMKRVAVK